MYINHSRLSAGYVSYTKRWGSFQRFGPEIGERKFTNFCFSKLISLANVRVWLRQIMKNIAKIDQKMGADNQGLS